MVVAMKRHAMKIMNTRREIEIFMVAIVTKLAMKIIVTLRRETKIVVEIYG